jgi:hypothetical protein
MQILAVGAAIREPMIQTRIAVGVAGAGPQPGFEGSDCASTDQRSFRDLLVPDFLSSALYSSIAVGSST